MICKQTAIMFADKQTLFRRYTEVYKMWSDWSFPLGMSEICEEAY